MYYKLTLAWQAVTDFSAFFLPWGVTPPKREKNEKNLWLPVKLIQFRLRFRFRFSNTTPSRPVRVKSLRREKFKESLLNFFMFFVFVFIYVEFKLQKKGSANGNIG